MYPALDRCVMLDLLRCPSRPCQSDDTGRSTKKIGSTKKSPLSLRVMYSGYSGSTSNEEVSVVKCPSSGSEVGTDACFVELSHGDKRST